MGQLIWGKLKGFDWWPGVVVELKTQANENHGTGIWVKWYGDNKFSKVISLIYCTLVTMYFVSSEN